MPTKRRRASKPRKPTEAALPDVRADLPWEGVPDGMYRIRGAEGKIEFLSGAFGKLTGWTPSEWLGRSFAELLHPEDLPAAVARYQAVCRGERLPPFELRVRTNSGDYRVGEVHSAPLLENGQVVGEIGIVRDVTERRTAEQAMRESEERFRLLLEAAFEGIGILEEGRVVDCNEDLAAMLGYTRDEVIGKSVFDFVAPEEAETVAERMRSGGGRLYEHRARRKDGSTFHVEVQGRALPYQGRHLRVAAIRDITERRRSERSQRATFRISEAAHTAPSLQELYAALHRIVGELMFARNFYIALYDAETDTLSFPYFVDEYDETPAPKPPGKGLTEYVLRTGRPLLATPEVSRELERRGEVELIGAPSLDWLGVPLVAAGKTTGVLVVQTYAEGVRFSEGDRDLLQFVSVQVAMAVQRKRAEEALRASEEQYRRLVEVAPDLIAVHSEGKCIFINQAGLRLLGARRPEDVVGRPMLDFVHPDSRPKVIERVRAMTQLGEAVPVLTERFLRLDGSSVNVEVAATPLLYQNRPAIQVVVHDITERMRAEAALRESEEKFRSFIETTADWVWTTDREGRHTYCNPAVERILGYPPEELVGRQAFTFIHPDDRARVVEQFGALVAEGRGWRDLVIRWLCKDGSTRFLESSAVPIIGADGKVVGYRGVDRDITEHRRLEDQLRQAQKMEAVGQLAGGVAHDFNNLLTTILASSELLASGLPADTPHREDVEMIHQAARRASELTRGLLAFSRRQTLELQAVPLGGLVADFARLARRLVPEDVEVTLEVEAPGAVVRADPGAIEQILMNLVTNARDAMPNGGILRLGVGTATVDEEYCRTRGWGAPGHYVVLTVADTGVGMDAKTQQHMFEPFFTTKPVGQGTGLGMAMVYGLVKQHGGFVSVYSELGRGTTVRIYLSPIAAEANAKPSIEAGEIQDGKETILLVEDDASLRRTAQRVLEKFGYTVVTATNGLDALNVIRTRRTPADLIISDIVMPHASGPQLLSALREAGASPRILFTSGYAARDVGERGPLSGDVPFLPKPWTIAELLRKVREVLDAPVP
jgi:PAS domain S-box-containing protein